MMYCVILLQFMGTDSKIFPCNSFINSKWSMKLELAPSQLESPEFCYLIGSLNKLC
jgi:hypothetical protein